MLAVFVNCAAVIFGSLIGLLAAKKITGELSSIIQTAAGIVTFVIGTQMAFKYESIVILTLSMIIGGVLGTWWDWDGKILAAGRALEHLVDRSRGSQLAKPADTPEHNFAYAFLNSSVLFCVGAMAILGSFKAGIEKDYTIIFTKSILDGFMAITFAAAMGVGTAFSALAIFIYQGALTLLSVLIKPYVTDSMISELTSTGGALIMMIGINLLGIKKIKTANYLPAVLLAVLFVIISPFVKSILPF